MQSKGTLGSIVAGVIAIFLVLVCLFYLSFSFVGNRYEKQAQEYAQQQVMKAGDKATDDTYNQAVKTFIEDSLGTNPLYLGYNYSEIQKWGVGLGLDLKGGMNVILQVSIPDILRSMKNAGDDQTFDEALAAADAKVRAHESDDFVGTFVEEYSTRNPNADFSVVFPDVIKAGANQGTVAGTLKAEVKDRVDNSATNVLRNRIDAFGVVSPNIQVLQGKDGQILLELPGVKDHERVRSLLQKSANLQFYETYTMDEVMPKIAMLEQELANGADSISLGAMFVELSPAAKTPIVGAATMGDTAAINSILRSDLAKKYIPSNAKFCWEVKSHEITDPRTGKRANAFGLIALKAKDDKGTPALDGTVVTSASADFDQMQGNVVDMAMNGEGAKQWARITKANLGKSVAIVLDDQVYSYPNVNSVIEGGRSQITGNFTIEEAQDLANVLKSGKMEARIEIISDQVIGPSLGQQAIESGFMSFVVALVLLMIFMVLIYGWAPGLIANLGLVCNLFFTLGILASFQAVLTLSGIAGIVLALGMAVDANVLIFERAKEELRSGKNIKQAVADGYSNAFSAIFDSNLTSIITGVILLLYGTGPIKGFATTLIIGIICSFFTAVYLSRIVFIMGQKRKWFRNLTFTTKMSRNMLTNTHVNFLGQRKVSFTVCGIFVVIVAISLFARGMNQGIDFSGGRNYIVKFEDKVDPTKLVDQIRAEIPAPAALSVIKIESSNQVRISTNYKINEESADVEAEIVGKLYKALKPYLGNMTEKEFSTTDESQGIVSSQKVGPSVADDMRNEAYIAVVLSLIAMFLYILLRFRNVAFSLGALAAVAFTAFTIIGFYSLFWGVMPFAMEVDQTFIAAILTVIGYQINDTVVVFDRVRENTAMYPKQNFFDTINMSINSTLSRTIMTSTSTLLVLLCIFILGGDAIRSFTFAMLFGVITGTLATIYVASPVAYLTDKGRKNSRERKAAKA